MPNVRKVKLLLAGVAFMASAAAASAQGNYTIGVSNTVQGNGWREEMICAIKAQALASANIGSLLQNGGGNIAQQGAVQGLSGAVIQNTLSNQNIQTLTTINASVNSLGLFKSMNLGATLNNALMNSVRPR